MGEKLAQRLEARLRLALNQDSWLLSCLNRDPGSQDYGSFDRAYWHYRTEREFAAATFQQSVLALTCLYLNPQWPLAGDPGVRAWISAALRNWAGLQRRDGSFDEWLPYEQSHVATAFSLAAVTEALLILGESGDPLPPDAAVMRALRAAGGYLCEHVDQVVLNHTAGAVTALYNLYLLTGQESYRAGAARSLRVLADSQSGEGWFPEYGGADIGYSFVSIDYLARYWRRSGDGQALELIVPALKFAADFVSPWGDVGGVYGSRNTRYLLPSGLIILGELEQARQTLDRWVTGQEMGRGLGLEAYDDRYKAFFLNSWLLALRWLPERKASLAAPCPKAQPKAHSLWPEAGLFRLSGNGWWAAGSFFKLGALEFAWQGGLACSGGYQLLLRGGKRATSQWHNKTVGVSLKKGPSLQFMIKGPFARLPDYEWTRKGLLPHRLVSHLLGRTMGGGKRTSDFVKARFIKPRRTTGITMERLLRVGPLGLKVSDRLYLGGQACKLAWAQGWGWMHVPSSNFFIPMQIEQGEVDVSGRRELTVDTAFDPDGGRMVIN